MMKYNVVYKKLAKPTKKTKKYDVKMLKNNNINAAYSSYTNEKLKLYLPLPDDTTEDKWNKIRDAIHNTASYTLKRNTLEPKKPWIKENIIKYIVEKRKDKNAKDHYGIHRYKE